METNRAAVLFDIDGTLVDSTYHHAIAWQRAFDAVGLPLPLWRIHRSIGMGGDKLVTHVAGERVEERHGDELRAGWREQYVKIKNEVFPLPGATDLVRGLVKDGYVVALASSGEPEFADEAVATLGIRDDLAALTSSKDVEASKPDPDLISTTLSRLGDQVDQAVMVGDTPYDVESAAKAGLRCVALRSGGYSEAELTDAGAALVVDAPEDLKDLEWADYLSPLS
jgi:HAD superfamily hydrolase (TIGR01509 family)